MKICTKCWKSSCEHSEYDYVEIDDAIVDIIIELNLKGYDTTYCCSGHDNVPDQIYIGFNKWVLPKGFNPAPVLGKDWKWIESTSIIKASVPKKIEIFRPSKKNPSVLVKDKRDFTVEESKIFLQERRKELRDWVHSLEENTANIYKKL
jgi:hypothetical protein